MEELTPAYSLLLGMVKELKTSIEKLTDKVDNIDKRLVVLEINDLSEMGRKIDRIDKSQAVIYGIAGFIGGVVGFFSDAIKGIFY